MGARTAFLFPGQGSQKIGMGRAWAAEFDAARQTFERADGSLGFPLSTLCWKGPEEDLQLTANTQPALLTTSVAIYRVIADLVPEPLVVAGHSLGEYSALVASGALEFETALGLVRRRGELMQEAVPVGVGAMAAILGLDAAEVERAAADAGQGDEICVAANFNSPKQTVVAGHRPAVTRAIEIAKELGARRAQLLPVSAPFHSPLMRPAREGLAPLLSAATFGDPRVPVVCNIDARPMTQGEAARDALERQVDGPVRWVASLERIADFGIDLWVEIGPGSVLSGLVKRTVTEPRTLSLSEPGGLADLQAASGSG